MTRRGWLVTGLVFLGVCAAGLWWFAHRPGVQVVVRNLGPAVLPNVVVHVTGNSYPVGDLRVGESRKVAVQCRGESHVELEFTDPSGQRRRIIAGGYFESKDYRGVITFDLRNGAIIRVDDRIRISLL